MMTEAELLQTLRDGLTLVAQDEVERAWPLLWQVRVHTDSRYAPQATLEMALLAHEQGLMDVAVATLMEADALAKPDVVPLTKVNIALAWQRLDHVDRAVNAYNAVLTAIPQDSARVDDDQQTAEAVAAYRLGQLAVQSGEKHEAGKHWQRALRCGDRDIAAHAALDLAELLSPTLYPHQVAEFLRLAIDCDHPDVSPRAAYRLAEMLIDLWQLAPAEKLLRDVVNSGHAVAPRARKRLDALRRDRAGATHRTDAPTRRDATRSAVGVRRSGTDQTRVIVVGAGTGGQWLCKELRFPYQVIGYVDDDEQRLAATTDLPIVGRLSDLQRLLKRQLADEVHMAIPTAPGRARCQVVAACRSARVPLRNLPSMYELNPSQSLLSQLRRVMVEELLGDQSVTVDRDAASWLQGRTVMVTGAASAYGAELARRAAQAAAAHIVLLDHDDVGLARIERELTMQRGTGRCFSVSGDGGSGDRLRALLKIHRVDVILHADRMTNAELAESNAVAAADRNLLRIYELAEAAGEVGVERFAALTSPRRSAEFSVLDTAHELAETVLATEALRYPQTTFCSVQAAHTLSRADAPLLLWQQQLEGGEPLEVPAIDRSVRLLRLHRAVELMLHGAWRAESGTTLRMIPDLSVNLQWLAEEFVRLEGREPLEHKIVKDTGQWDEAAYDDVPPQPFAGHPHMLVIDRRPISPTNLIALARELRVLVERGEAVETEDFLRRRMTCVKHGAQAARRGEMPARR